MRPDLPNSGINNGIKKLTMVRVGLRLDVFASPLAGSGIVRQSQPTRLRRDLRKLLDDVEERSFVSPRKLPTIGDRARKDLLGSPVMRCSRVC